MPAPNAAILERIATRLAPDARSLEKSWTTSCSRSSCVSHRPGRTRGTAPKPPQCDSRSPRDSNVSVWTCAGWPQIVLGATHSVRVGSFVDEGAATSGGGRTCGRGTLATRSARGFPKFARKRQKSSSVSRRRTASTVGIAASTAMSPTEGPKRRLKLAERACERQLSRPPYCCTLLGVARLRVSLEVPASCVMHRARPGPRRTYT